MKIIASNETVFIPLICPNSRCDTVFKFFELPHGENFKVSRPDDMPLKHTSKKATEP
jgi:hypothetical protein